MQSPLDTEPPAKLGRRERKRQETAERLARVAQTLFIERGYNETTLQDITDAADISLRNFFHYYSSKEDLVDSWQEEMRHDIIADVATWPDDVPLLRLAFDTVIHRVAVRDREINRQILDLISRTPALQARDLVKNAELEATLTLAIEQRFAARVSPLLAGLAAAVALGAIRAGTRIWVEDGARADIKDFAAHVRGVLYRDLMIPALEHERISAATPP